MKKYKILKDCKYSPDGVTSKSLKPGDEADLPDSIGVPFEKKGFCKECKPENKVEKTIEKVEAPKEEPAKEEESEKKEAPEVKKPRARKKK